jgi:transketolase
MFIGLDFAAIVLGRVSWKCKNGGLRLVFHRNDMVLTADKIRDARLRLLRMHYESGVGHIGGNLSALDILLCLYHDVLKPADRFVLSKGHAAGAIYVALWSVGLIDESELLTFHKDGTRLSGHPPADAIQQILFATGSLGHGQGLAAGLAMANRLKHDDGRVFCLTSDGEWNEGSSWESLIFIAHQRLENLTFIVDANGLQGFGTTKEVADLDPLADKFRTFGLETIEIDGHDAKAIVDVLNAPQTGPRVIVARTVKGSGVSFMANRMEWHYLPLKAEQYAQAVREISSR